MPQVPSPAATSKGPAGAPERPAASLSPSRAGDFMTCPLLYRFRVIDALPEPPGLEAMRGTLVHAVLERLFDLPASDRTLQKAGDMVPQQWEELVTAQSEDIRALLFGPESNWGELREDRPMQPADAQQEADFLSGAHERLSRYFELEDPTRIEPAERELFVTAELPDGLVLRGFVDRLDRAADGRTRVVDYKTGKAPRDLFAQKAMFQMKCYALALWRAHGRIPTVLQLIYLGNSEILRYEPDEQDLLATERKLVALWKAILRATDTGDWRPRKSRLCDWCAHQSICPEWGGTPPDLPPRQEEP